MPAVPAAMPPRPDETAPGAGPKGLPAVDWSFGKALAMGFLTNLNFIATVLIIVASLLGGSQELAPQGDTVTGAVEVLVGIVIELIWLGGMVLWLQRRYPGWRARLGIFLGRRGVRDGVWGFATGLVMYVAIALIVGVALTALFQLFSDSTVTTPDQIPSHMSGAATVLMVLVAVVLAPIVEEFCFRGLIFRSIRDRHGFWKGAVVSGLLFGVVHFVPFNPWQDTVLLQSIMVFTGVGLAWIYERRGNLVSNIAAHMAFNTIGIILILFVH